jgi:hypothetical protein
VTVEFITSEPPANRAGADPILQSERWIPARCIGGSVRPRGLGKHGWIVLLCPWTKNNRWEARKRAWLVIFRIRIDQVPHLGLRRRVTARSFLQLTVSLGLPLVWCRCSAQEFTRNISR